MPAFVPVVIAGGSGARLWPFSRRGLPKPFVELPGRARPLLDDTYARLFGAGLPPPAAVITIAASDYGFLCRERYAAAGGGAPHIVIGEPFGQNTAPAIAVACEMARRRFGDDALIAVLPADHAIDDAALFRAAAARALAGAKSGRLALLGLPPAYPATGFGYIECGENLAAEEGMEQEGLFAVRRFVEKPDAERARQYAAAGNFLWNSGMFFFAAGRGMAEISRCAPEVHKALPAVFAGADADADEFLPAAAAYSAFPIISFDYAVMEKTEHAAVARADNFGWSDVGSWRAVAGAVAADERGNRVAAAKGRALLQECDDCFVAAGGGRLVAGLGLRGVYVLDTPDALLVADAAQPEAVRGVYEALGERDEAATAPVARRPWGSYTVLQEGQGYKVKRIDVLPGQKLSLQSHKHRAERWTCVQGEMGVVIEQQDFTMRAGDACHIPLGAKHRMYNPGTAAAAVIEVQTGDYLGEDDIVRYEDIYGRAE